MNGADAPPRASLAPAGLLDAIADPGRRNRPALGVDAGTLSYDSLRRAVHEVAAALAGAGIRPGDRVLLLFGNEPAHVVAVLAVLSLGAVAVPLADESGDARLAAVVEDAEPRLCLGTATAPRPTAVPTLELSLDLSGGVQLGAAGGPATRGSGAAAWPVPVAPETIAFIRYTSGSTGTPKGVVLDHSQQSFTARTLARTFGIDAAHRELVIAPIAHSGAWQRVVATLSEGGSVHFATAPLSVPGLLEDLVEREATGFFTPPPLVRMLLAARADRVARGLAGCRTLEIGSAPVGAAEVRGLMELAAGARVFVHYGLTECSRAVILDARRHPDKLHSVGCAAAGAELRVADERDRALPPGRSGEIQVRAPQCTRAYWKRPDLSEERLRGGWLHTGDHGRLDEDGFLVFLGRGDDLVTSGGFSFFPAEAERELGSVDGVTHYLIAGVPDARGVLGEVPWAFLVSSLAEDDAIRRFSTLARRRLPAYMVPRRVVVVPELPLTASGKPDRRRAVEKWGPKREE